MTLVRQVVEIVERRETTTVDAVMHYFPECTRKEIARAFNNAFHTGQIKRLQAGQTLGRVTVRGYLQAVYAPINPRPLPVASVFELGTRALEAA